MANESFLSLVVPPDGLDGPAGPAHWYVVRSGEVLIGAEGGPLFGEPPIGASEEPIIVGQLGQHPVWAMGVGGDVEAPAGSQWVGLLTLASQVPEDRWALAGRAVQLVEWSRTSRFCGRCATATIPSPGERARRCPDCGLLAYPRLAPAVITLVERGGEALLAHGRNFGIPMYSCLAGFVEPGETLEEAVHREVAEEVGVTLGEVRYFGSQPWPFPHQLMIGFTATWASGDIKIDEIEIDDAGWFTPDAMPMIPPGMSISRLLIDDWLERQGVSPD
jgi:NAD+ diphosphatase